MIGFRIEELVYIWKVMNENEEADGCGLPPLRLIFFASF
jgi:hypothetical protein